MGETLVPGIPDAFLVVWVAAIGALIGSFLNVVIYRVPTGRSIVSPGSRCGFCESSIAWYDNVPVLSWVLLGGRCRRCGVSISARYTLVEILTSLAFVAVLLRFGVAPHTPVFAAFVAALIAISFIDIDHRIIPDGISKSGIVAGVLIAAVLPRGGPLLPVTLPAAFAGAVLGYFLLLAAVVFGKMAFGREAMGLGDVKLLSMIGAFLGPIAVPFVVGFAAIAGTAISVSTALARGRRLRGSTLPFGPYLALGAAAYLLAGQELVLAWLRAMGAAAP